MTSFHLGLPQDESSTTVIRTVDVTPLSSDSPDPPRGRVLLNVMFRGKGDMSAAPRGLNTPVTDPDGSARRRCPVHLRTIAARPAGFASVPRRS